MFIFRQPAILISAAALFFFSCESTNEPEADRSGTPDRMFIPAYGTWGKPGTSTLSVYHFEGDSLERDAFKRYNDKALYDGAQSVALAGQKLFISCLDAGIVSVLDIRTMKEIATISFPPGTGPNYLHYSPTGFVFLTGVYSGNLYKISVASLSVTDSVKVGSNPVQMAETNGKLFVANSGYGYDTTLSVIDLPTFKVVKTITTGQNPSFIKKVGSKLVYLTSGNNWDPHNLADAVLYLFNPETYEVDDSLVFINTYLYVELAVDSDNNVYLDDNGTKRFPVSGDRFGESYCLSETGGHPVAAGKDIFTIGQNYTNQLVRLTDGKIFTLGPSPSGNAVISYVP